MLQDHVWLKGSFPSATRKVVQDLVMEILESIRGYGRLVELSICLILGMNIVGFGQMLEHKRHSEVVLAGMRSFRHGGASLR